MITSIQNPRLKHVRDLLAHPHDRQATGQFVVEGIRLVEEALSAGWQAEYMLYSRKLNSRGMAIIDRYSDLKAEILEVDPGLLDRISDTEQSQGILAVLKQQVVPEPSPITLVLILDAVRDPGNMGTILRSAAAAGVQSVWLAPETTDPFAPKVLRAGMGAQFRLSIQSLAWDEILQKANNSGLFLYLSDMDQGIPLWQANLKQPVGLIVSNEADGATGPARSCAGGNLFIPMPGKFESLNVGVAAAILMFETVRQRG